MKNRNLMILALAVCSLAACGGGGGGNDPEPLVQSVPPKAEMPVWNHPVTAINNTFTLTAGDYNFAGTHHSGYEGNSLNLGVISATPTFGQLSTIHFQDDNQPDKFVPSTHIMFYGQDIPRNAWDSVTVTKDDGTQVILQSADAKYTQAPLNQDGTVNPNTATYWSYPGNVFDLSGGRTYTVTFNIK